VGASCKLVKNENVEAMQRNIRRKEMKKLSWKQKRSPIRNEEIKINASRKQISENKEGDNEERKKLVRISLSRYRPDPKYHVQPDLEA